MKIQTLLMMLVVATLCGHLAADEQRQYPVVGTGQVQCFDASGKVIRPSAGQAFFGQDAQSASVDFSLRDNGDGTVTDLITGLMWEQTPTRKKMDWFVAVKYSKGCQLAGYDDWRLPTLKELFSLSDFKHGWPYLDESYFGLAGSGAAGDAINKDEQYWANNFYIGATHGGRASAFGVNHATGHIKAYPAKGGGPRGKHVRLVRGESYGVNDFVDNDDGTITDRATGLMWAQADSGAGMDWEQALKYAADSELAGYSEWRLPNVKELQSIVDYSHAPNAVFPEICGPAINTSYFKITALPPGSTEVDPDCGYVWTSTSAYHGKQRPEYCFAWYVAFGSAPDREGNDIHGAGGVRFDAKVKGSGLSMGDAERIHNFVRLVRNVQTPIVKQAPTQHDAAQ